MNRRNIRCDNRMRYSYEVHGFSSAILVYSMYSMYVRYTGLSASSARYRSNAHTELARKTSWGKEATKKAKDPVSI